jgi:hypothetical protein
MCTKKFESTLLFLWLCANMVVCIRRQKMNPILPWESAESALGTGVISTAEVCGEQHITPRRDTHCLPFAEPRHASALRS